MRMKAMFTFVALALTCALACSPASAQAPAQPAGQASPRAPGAVSAGFDGSAYGKARDLEARIVSFAAQPPSIKPGESVTLVWQTENPTGVTIDPEPGRVTPRGSRQVKPSATTTYTLTARGPNNQVLTKTVTVTVAGTAAAAALARPDAAKKATPRLDGKPDFSGVYGAGGGGGARGAAAPGAAPAGPVLKAGAEKYRIVRAADDTGATANCMPLVPPQSWGVPYQFQILQNPHFIAIFHEYPGTFRLISMDTPHPVDPDPSWLGDSVGKWEGDTLFVDTFGVNDKTELHGYRHTDALHMVERFRRTDVDTIQYEVTIEDPNVFEKPYTLTRTFSLRPDLRRIDEFICENNRDYRPLFGK